LCSNKAAATAAFAKRKGLNLPTVTTAVDDSSKAPTVSRRERTEASFMADGRDALSTQQSLSLQGMYPSSSCDSEAASESPVDTNLSDSFQPQPRHETLFDEERNSSYCDSDCEGCDRCADKWIDRHEREVALPPRMALSGESGGEPIFHYGTVGTVSRWGLTRWLGSKAHVETSWPMVVGDFLVDDVVPARYYKLFEWSARVEYLGEAVGTRVLVALPTDLAELVRNFEDEILVRDGAVRDHLRRLLFAASHFARGEGQQKCRYLVPEAIPAHVGKRNGLKFVPDRPVEADEVPAIEVMSVSEFGKLVPSVIASGGAIA
jgi:hypothetical protein